MNKTKKLSIQRDTLKALDGAALTNAHGGAIAERPPSAQFGCTNGCTRTCTQARPCLGSRNC